MMATSSPSSGNQNSLFISDDDLVSQFGADSFAIESRRDKDLRLLSDFLASALPPAQQGYPQTQQGQQQQVQQAQGQQQPQPFRTQARSPSVSSAYRYSASPKGWAPSSPHADSMMIPRGRSSSQASGQRMMYGSPSDLAAPANTPHGTPSFSSLALPQGANDARMSPAPPSRMEMSPERPQWVRLKRRSVQCNNR